jgi:WD40 repeat protein
LSQQPPNDRLEGGQKHTPIAFTPDSRVLATVNSNCTEVLLWDVASGQPAAAQTGVLTNRLVQPADLHRLLSAEEASPSNSASVTNFAIEDLMFSPQGLLAVACSFNVVTPQTNYESHRIELWDIRHGVLRSAFPGQGPVRFATNGDLLACRDAQKSTTILFRDLKSSRVWSSEEGRLRFTLEMGLAFTPDGETLASTGLETCLWDVATGKLRRRLSSVKDRPVQRAQPPFYTAAFTPNGELFLSSGEVGEIWVWEMSHLEQPRYKLRSHLETVYSLTVSPDGKTLATGDLNGLIKLWRLGRTVGSSGTRWDIRELVTLHGHEALVNNLQFSPDSTLLVSASWDGVVLLWRAPK